MSRASTTDRLHADRAALPGGALADLEPRHLRVADPEGLHVDRPGRVEEAQLAKPPGTEPCHEYRATRSRRVQIQRRRLVRNGVLELIVDLNKQPQNR
eukprot:6206747-Pleurochrysis_carterae.AAC.8